MSAPTKQLADMGQSLWLDNITRAMLDDGTIERYVADYSVTGLTSNPSIFDKAIEGGGYDGAIAAASAAGLAGEDLFFELAIEDLRRAADLFAPAHEASGGVDGFVSLEVSPELAYDTDSTVTAARDLHARAERHNLFIKIPGTPEGLPAITEAIAAGVPVNVTLLFDAAQYQAAAEAYMAGIERRIASGEDPVVASVASVFMSRWDKAVADSVPAELKDRLALAVGGRTYRTYREVLASQRWSELTAAGAKPQRLLWASTSTKDPAAPDTLYVNGLAAPDTINTLPDVTLEAFFDHGVLGDPMPLDGGDAEAELARFEEAGIDLAGLAAKLQSDGAEAFVASWTALMSRIEQQSTSVR
ncbi:MAG: transaldolase [Microthrixaceae bacterium]